MKIHVNCQTRQVGRSGVYRTTHNGCEERMGTFSTRAVAKACAEYVNTRNPQTVKELRMLIKEFRCTRL